MRRLYSQLVLGAAALFCGAGQAQVAAYQFAQSDGTFTPITSGTVIATATANTAPGNLSGMVWNLPNGTFPFPFTFNGTAYTGCNISCNGYITFGTVPPTNSGAPISINTAYDGAIVAWGRSTYGAFDLGTTPPLHTSELMVDVIGTAPNRIIVIQYSKWRYSGSTTTTSWLQDYQIRLYETSNIVEIMYGPGVMAGGSLSTSGFNMQVGLRGASNADFNNRQSFGLFNSSTAGTANNHNQVIGVTSGNPIFMPPDGLTYRWYPPCSNGTVVSPTIAVNSSVVCIGDTINFSGSGETPFFDINYQWRQSTIPGGPYTAVPDSASGTSLAAYQTTANPGFLYFVLVTTCSSVPSSAMSNEITVEVRPRPSVSIMSNPPLQPGNHPVLEACAGETYTLTAMGADSYSWTGGPSGDQNVIQPSGNPSYTVTGTSLNGCSSTEVIEILVNPLPLLSMLASPDSVCPGETVVVGATGDAAYYTWLGQNSNAFMISVKPTATTVYSVIATSAKGCTISATQQVAVHNVAPLVVSQTPTLGTICRGEKVIFTATGASHFTWTATGTYTTGAMVEFWPTTTTNYTVRGANAKGCLSETYILQEVSNCVGFTGIAGSASLLLYPNPNNGLFVVELNTGEKCVLEMLDLSGRVVYTANTEDHRTSVNISDLANGIYYLRVQSQGRSQMVKVVKE